VPEAEVAAARALVGAVMAVSGYEFSDIPAMRSESAIRALLAALERETTDAAARLQEEVAAKAAEMAAAEGKEGMARRAAHLARRAAAVEAMTAKLARYEEMFGRPAEAAANRVAHLRANVQNALRYAVARAEGRDADAPRLLDLDDRAVRPVRPVADQASPGAEARFAGLAAEALSASPAPDGLDDPNQEDGPGRKVDLD